MQVEFMRSRRLKDDLRVVRLAADRLPILSSENPEPVSTVVKSVNDDRSIEQIGPHQRFRSRRSFS